MRTFVRSNEMLERAMATIPLGTQTFSKSVTQYPRGVSPHFLTRGRGARVWDVDGNEYADFVNSLAAITLGYCDPDVDAAVRAALDDGVVFSLAHPLEIELAELLRETVPSAEMVRYGKNGSDATAGAIRVARAFTGRDRVATCGYHGWQDWYIGATARNKGVPRAVRDLTHTFVYNDIDSLKLLLDRHRGEFAAVIMEPMNVHEPKPGFLEEVAGLTRSHGALLVFDETITGFRYHVGGAQALFGVTPDLSTFGKGLANGYPISAVVGKARFMREMEEVFYSFTFGGEILSIAAAVATVRKLKREPVIERIFATGSAVMELARAELRRAGLDAHFSVSGHPSWSFLVLADVGHVTSWELKTLLLQEMFQAGVLTLGTHNVSYSHGAEDLALLRDGYRSAFGLMREVLDGRPISDVLRCRPLEPLFKVR